MAKTYDKQPSRTNREAYEALASGDGRLQPQALDLEEAVLGALMLEKDCIVTVQEYLTAAAFYDERHRFIYEAVEELSGENKPVDLLTVTDKLRQNGKLKTIGGAAYLAQLTQKVASAMNVEFHSTIVAQKHIQRELIRIATEIQRRSYDDGTDVTELIEYAESEIFNVTEGHIKREAQSARILLDKVIKSIEEAAAKGGTMNGVPSGFTKLDAITLGWQPSDLIIIAARPSMGKTAFVLSMARNITVDHERPVAFFSLEMSATSLMLRLIVAESQLSSTDVRSGRLTTDQWQHLEQSTRQLSGAPLYIDDTPALSVTDFRSKVRKLKAQHDIQLIIIDYLQLMTTTLKDSKGNREQEVAAISRTLKAIAKELDIPIIALSQLNRSVESRGGSKRPQLSDLRESGAIEQDADIVAFIHRPEYYGLTVDENQQSTAGMAELIIAKHRNGATDTVKLRFRKEQARFSDYDDADGYNNFDSSIDGAADMAAVGAGNFGGAPEDYGNAFVPAGGMNGSGAGWDDKVPF